MTEIRGRRPRHVRRTETMNRVLALVVVGLVLVGALSSSNAYAQQRPTPEQALKDLTDHGFTGLRCDSFVTLSSDKASEPVTNVIGAWLGGYIQGVGVALDTITQDPGKTILALEPQNQLLIAAILVSAFRGTPTLLQPASIATRRSQLADYCQSHPAERIEEAAGGVLMTTLKLPQYQKPK